MGRPIPRDSCSWKAPLLAHLEAPIFACYPILRRLSWPILRHLSWPILSGLGSGIDHFTRGGRDLQAFAEETEVAFVLALFMRDFWEVWLWRLFRSTG